MESYKTIDDLQRFLCAFVSQFPHLIRYPAAQINTTNLFPPESDFCDLLPTQNPIAQGRFGEIIPGAVLGAGGFGAIGILSVKEGVNENKKELAIAYPSLNPNAEDYPPAFAPGYVKVVMKQFRRGAQECFPITITRNGNIFELNDPIAEMFFSAQASLLFDAGITPNVPKFIGEYKCGLGCALPTYNNFFLLSEKLGFNLYQVFDLMTEDLFWTMILQVLFALKQLKIFFNMVHLDLHPGNIMYKDYTNDPNYMYQAKRLKDIQQFVYDVGDVDGNGVRKYLSHSNLKAQFKIIDFGVCVSKSAASAPHPLEFLNSSIANIAGGREAYNSLQDPANAILDINFFLFNILLLLEHKRNIQTDPTGGVTSDQYGFYNYMQQLYPDLAGDFRVVQSGKINFAPGNPWYNNRNTVTRLNGPATPDFFLQTLFRFFRERPRREIYSTISLFGQDFIPNEPQTILLNGEPSRFLPEFVFYESVINSINNTNMQPDERFDSNTLFRKPLVGFTVIASDNQVWDMGNRCLIKPLPLTDRYEFYRTNELQIYTYQIYPEQLQMQKIHAGTTENLKYYRDQKWFNFKSVDKVFRNLPQYMPNVNIWVLRFNQTGNKKFFIEPPPLVEDDMMSRAERLVTSKGDAVVNGNFFIVEANVQDPLGPTTPHVQPADIKRPIGFFYKPGYPSSPLPVPPGYEKSFALIYKDLNGFLQMTSYSSFLTKCHQKNFVEQIPFMIASERELSAQLIDIPNIPPGKKWWFTEAFVSGPILIWNGVVVFNRVEMNTEFAVIENRRLVKYKVTNYAQDYRKFVSQEGETTFPYGQRVSNLLVTQHVLGWDAQGNVYSFLLEGRGFNAPGLDRAQMAELVSVFGIQYAVELDGGFSANAVVWKGGRRRGKKYLLTDPQRRDVGLLLSYRAAVPRQPPAVPRQPAAEPVALPPGAQFALPPPGAFFGAPGVAQGIAPGALFGGLGVAHPPINPGLFVPRHV